MQKLIPGLVFQDNGNFIPRNFLKNGFVKIKTLRNNFYLFFKLKKPTHIVGYDDAQLHYNMITANITTGNKTFQSFFHRNSKPMDVGISISWEQYIAGNIV
jgi:hypothetical protein